MKDLITKKVSPFCGVKRRFKTDANTSNISPNIVNFRCWTKCWMHSRSCKILKKKKKEDKNQVGQCWVKFVLDQAFRPTFSGSSNHIFMLHAFEYSSIQHLVFHHCVECKTYEVDYVSNTFIDIRMSIICGVPQKIKRREGHK